MLGKLRQSLILKLALARSRVGIFALREKHWEPISRGLPWQKKSLGFVATLKYSKEVIFQRYSNGGDLERFQLISLCQLQSQRGGEWKKANCYKKNPLAVFNWTLENILMFSCIEQSAQNIPVDGKGDTLVSISVKCCWHWSLDEKTFCEFHGIQFLKSSTLRFHLRNVRDEVKKTRSSLKACTLYHSTSLHY